MFAKLQLFGLGLTIDGTGNIAAPTTGNLNVKKWLSTATQTEAKIDCWLEVSAKCTLRFLARLAIEASAGDASSAVASTPQNLPFPATTFGLWDQLFNSLPAAAAFTVKLGGIRYLSNTFPIDGLAADSGTLLLVGPQLPLLADSGLPIGIFSGQGGLRLDLQAEVATFLAGAFLQRTSYGLNVDIGGGQQAVIELLGNSATSHSLDIQLSSPSAPSQLLFQPDTNDPMPLHIDLQDRTQPQSKDNRVWVPLATQNHLLKFTMGAVADQAVLNGLSVIPKNGTLDILAYGYSDKKNQPALLQSGSELQLVSRIGEDSRPSALMVRAAYSDNQPLVSEAGNDAALHGLVQKSRFSLNNIVNVHCNTDVSTTVIPPASLHADVVRELTLPFFKSLGGNTGLTLGRPGDSWLSNISGVLQNLEFHGTAIALPLLTPTILQNNFVDLAKQHYADLDKITASQNAPLQSVVHETHLTEIPVSPSVQPSRLLGPQLEQTVGASVPAELDTHTVSRSYGPITLQLDLPKGQNLDYFVIAPDKLQAISSFKNIDLVSGSSLFTAIPITPSSASQLNGLPAAIAKFSTTNSLLDILHGIGADTLEPVSGKGPIKDLLDPTLVENGWTGLLLFKVPFLTDTHQSAGQLIPSNLNAITYFALTPAKSDSTDAFSVTARMIWQNDDVTPGSVKDPQESLFRLNELDITWRDRKLASYYANATLQVHSFFGVQHDKPAEITIIGSYDQRTDAITFLGRLPNPEPLLPDDPGFGPIRQVYVSSASIKMVGGKTTILLDGSIDLDSASFAGGLFKTQNGRQIQFSGLGITISDAKNKSWQGLEITYPSIQLNFDLPPFNFGFLAAKMNSLWVDWLDLQTGKRGFDFGSIVPLVTAPAFKGPNFIFDLSLDLMKLPELALVGLDRLNLDFYIGLGLGDGGAGLRRWLPANLSVGLRALGFDGLHLNLLRFLEITADHVVFDSVNETDSNGTITQVPCLALQNVAIKILGRTIVSNLTAFLFSQPDGQACFAIFSAQRMTAGPITVRWVMVGHNISLSQDLAIQMMDVGATADGADQSLVKAIDEAGANKKFTPGTSVNQGRWIFAAAFSFAGLLDGKFLFQDQAYYGIALGGGIFKSWFGYDIAISVLYIKGHDPSQDAFAISLRVPQVTLPSFQFMGGELALNIAMNGSFVLDIGFPHLSPNGSRQWDRALGAIVTPYQGSGGFYIQKYTVSTPVLSQPGGLLISAGYAVQVGLGGSFGGGVLTAWVTAGIYFIVEGSVYLQGGNVAALRLAGAVGLVVRGGARLNFWIISVTIEIMLSAEARAVLIWGQMPPEYKLIGGSDAVLDGGNRVSLQLALTVYASASAEACIGGGWFRICKSISVSIPLRYQLALELN